MSGATESYQYSLGTIGEPLTYNLLVEITEAEYEEIDSGIVAIARLSTPFDYKLVERNFLDLESIHEFVTITISLGRRFASPDHRMLGEALMSSTLNWLTSARLFLDHTETDLKRRFGKTSQEAQRFKAATSSAFYKRVGYRFIYKFRNYVQHCGPPLSRIEVRQPDEQARTRGKQWVELLLDRDELLSNYDEWGPVKRDLQAMPPAFPLLPLVSDAMEGFREIYAELLDIKLTEALSHCELLERTVARIEETGTPGQPTVFKYKGDFSGELQITPRILSAEGIRKLARVADGSASRESIIRVGERRQQRKFDPATIRKRFHRDDRGVQVLSAFLREKGATPAFIDAVNAMIAKDQSIQPLISGLINVSTLFAHLAAGAIGATAEGLVAGLIEDYGQFDQPTDERPTDEGL
jgi:hypothetical protein